MATNFGQLAFFSESKNQLSKRTDWSEKSVTVASSFVGGFFAAFFSLPFDLIKTRLQRGKGPGGQSYAGVLDCAVKIVKDEGPMRFYRGFGTYVSQAKGIEWARARYYISTFVPCRSPRPCSHTICPSLTCVSTSVYANRAAHSHHADRGG